MGHRESQQHRMSEPPITPASKRTTEEPTTAEQWVAQVQEECAQELLPALRGVAAKLSSLLDRLETVGTPEAPPLSEERLSIGGATPSSTKAGLGRRSTGSPARPSDPTRRFDG